ncbi:MAG: hypothetical protein HKP46_20115 [Myxococcales bacterium]|nr:hypothetical protein [Myxococcales bacterium]
MRLRPALPFIFALLVPALLATNASAQRLTPSEVPDGLKPWVPWVLHAAPNHRCTLAGGAAICRWPGALALSVNDTGARFEQRFFLDRDGEVQLPGSPTLWPQLVRVNGQPVVVLQEGERPVIRLQSGEHLVTGELRWETAPELLPVPNQTAIVRLQIKGKPVQSPRREKGGEVWLGAKEEVETTVEGLEVEVHRKIADAIPMQVTTRLVLHVSGRARELNFKEVLLANTIPIAVTSQLPVRLDKQRRLSVQVHAGTYEVLVIAEADGDLESLVAPKPPSPWPSLETWVWRADESLRQVELSGAPNVDTSRASLPSGWRDLPAYSLTPGQALAFKTTRRAKAEAEPNVVQLARELWLDVDGTGYSVRDQISGQLRRSHRLILEEGTLGRVELSNEGQLINDLGSAGAAEGAPAPRGVEIRTAQLAMSAESRLEDARSSFPAVGWSENIERLSALLRLPPGWDVLAISGADDTSQTWLSRWDVFAIFFVALIAIAALRLLGPFWGLVALLALTLTFHQAGAPLFIWVVLLGLLALRRVVTSPSWSRGLTTLWWGAGIALVLIAVPFCVSQLRSGLFPHVGVSSIAWLSLPWLFAWAVLVVGVAAYRTAEVRQVSWKAVLGFCVAASFLFLFVALMFGGGFVEYAMQSRTKVDMAPQITPEEEQMEALGGAADDESYVLPKSRKSLRSAGSLQPAKVPMTQQQDPNAVVQTGEGIPDWESNSWELRWSGPVPSDHRVKLWLISPRANLLASIARVLLLVLLALGVMRRWKRTQVPPIQSSAALTSISIALLAGAVLLGPSHAAAQRVDPEGTPSPAILDELAKRLTAPPECAPDCVTVAQASIDATSSRIVFEADVHVGATSAFRMPGPASAWLPSSISVDGEPGSAVALAADGFALLRLEAGVHRVRLEGFAPPGESLTLAFGDHPKHLTVRAKGWEVDGLRDNGRADASIQLRRKLTRQEGETGQAEAVRLQPWFEVRRTVGIGVRWTVNTTVRRISPSSAVDVVRIPLLRGEEVTKADALVEDGHIVITIPRGETRVSWSSSLEPSAELSLLAPKSVRWSEVWVLSCGPIFRCQHAGLPPIAHFQNGLWQPLFRPWPGEELQLSFDRPPAAEGSVLTIDALTLQANPGLRRTQSKLTATVRSSSGGVHAWTLPQGAELQSVTVDGSPRSLQMQGNELRTTLRPGVQQVQIAFQQEGGLGTWFRTSPIGLGAPVVNARVRVDLPDDRWLLWTRGPAWGAVVLFWPYLLLALLVAFLLSRLPRSPLRVWDWLLLSLGFVTLPVWVAVPVVAWFFALQHRSQDSTLPHRAFNVRQVLLAGLSVVALLCFYAAVHTGLLVYPDMQVAGAGSYGSSLEWYIDRSSNDLPQTATLSLSIWVWRVLMLAWSLWLAFRLVAWVRWAWSAFSTDGRWKTKPHEPAPEG